MEVAMTQPSVPQLRLDYTRGRALYVAGGTLEECTSTAMRAGFVGAEADGRRADLRAMLAVSFDEWKLHRSEYDGQEW